MTRVLYLNRPAESRIPAPDRTAWTFHQSLDGYAPTRLRSHPRLAELFDVSRVDVKLEVDRFGLPSFKIMGASWATVQALRPLLPNGWAPEHGISTLAGALPDVTLITATDGNHGRALAFIARLLGLRCEIYVPEALDETRIEAIASEGAQVVRVAGTYDDAVTRSAAEADRPGRILVSDTSWPGYERTPAAVVDGYATILWELDEQLTRSPDLVLVQLGVGSFGAAVIRHFRRLGTRAPRIVGVEPTRAACVMASLSAGQPVMVPGPHDSVMAGLNCGAPSMVAWPTLRDGLDAVIALDDKAALDGVRTLAAMGDAVGECSGVVVTAARELLAGPDAAVHRARLDLGADSAVLLFATEGVTGDATYPGVPGADDLARKAER